MHHNKRRIYFKNIYKTDFRLKTLMFKKKRKRSSHLYSTWAYKRGGGLYLGDLIFGIIYSLANGWAYIWGGLKPGRFKSGILRYITNNKINEY